MCLCRFRFNLFRSLEFCFMDLGLGNFDVSFEEFGTELGENGEEPARETREPGFWR